MKASIDIYSQPDSHRELCLETHSLQTGVLPSPQSTCSCDSFTRMLSVRGGTLLGSRECNANRKQRIKQQSQYHAIKTKEAGKAAKTSALLMVKFSETTFPPSNSVLQ